MIRPEPAQERDTAQPGGPGHRERASRTLTLLMTGKLVAGSEQGLCRLRNISATGMMIETRLSLSVAQPIHVELRNGKSLSGRIVWWREDKAGVQFDEPVVVKDVVAVEAPVSRILRSRAPRSPRVPRRCPIEVQVDGERHGGTLHDISQGGVRVSLPFRPAIGSQFPIMIPGLPTKLGIVRWSGAEVGLSFLEPLSFDALGAWLASKIEDQPAP